MLVGADNTAEGAGEDEKGCAVCYCYGDILRETKFQEGQEIMCKFLFVPVAGCLIVSAPEGAHSSSNYDGNQEYVDTDDDLQ